MANTWTLRKLSQNALPTIARLVGSLSSQVAEEVTRTGEPDAETEQQLLIAIQDHRALVRMLNDDRL